MGVTVTGLKLAKAETGDREYVATWAFSKTHLDNYTVQFQYLAKTSADSGGVWIEGSSSTTKNKSATYTAPEGASQIRVRVKPTSTKTKKKGKKKTYWWTGAYSAYVSVYVYDYFSPEPPSTPSITVDGNKITVSCENLNVGSGDYGGVDRVRFHIVKNDSGSETKEVTVSLQKATYTFTGSTGSSYRVRAAARNIVYRTITTNVQTTVTVKGKKVKKTVQKQIRQAFDYWSDYSQYSSYVDTNPLPPENVKVSVKSETSLLLSWTASKTAKSYIIHCADNVDELKLMSGSSYKTYNTEENATSYIISDLSTGSVWYFRMQSVNSSNSKSDYSSIVSVAFGSKPEAPTTWSSTSTAFIGETVHLYWVHNAEDGSDQVKANIEVSIDGKVVLNVEKTNTKDEYGEYSDETSVYDLDTSSYKDSSELLWRVRTKGITNEYGEWSIQRSIKVYEKPSLTVNVLDREDGDKTEVVDKLPIYLRLTTTPPTQIPIGYNISVISTDSYETVDAVGQKSMVVMGDEVYSKYFDGDGSTDPLLLTLYPSDIDIQNGVTYEVKATASFNSGLTADSASSDREPEKFIVAIEDESYEINAGISYNPEDMTASISPYCTYVEATGLEFLVDHFGNYLCDKDGNFLIGIFKPEDNLVDNENEVLVDDIEYADGVTLSVYRREANGKFVEIATGIPNDGTVITDPHPSLDYARYRIVATSDSTGAISYDDVSEIVDENFIVIQWGEQWTNFDGYDEDDNSAKWNGSMIKLPYNIDITESNTMDVSLVEYIGRKRPVSYYGTQLGESPSWSGEIPKDDIETIYQLRRLMVYPGDVYVREPSGTGYWAQVSVSINIKHKSLTVPVTLTIRPVEGGM